MLMSETHTHANPFFQISRFQKSHYLVLHRENNSLTREKKKHNKQKIHSVSGGVRILSPAKAGEAAAGGQELPP